jgi:hypothetical protein
MHAPSLKRRRNQPTTSTSTSVAMRFLTGAPIRQLARAWKRCRVDHLYRHSKQPRLPLLERVIAPKQRRRRPPVFDWASSASPRAGKRARMRTVSSPNSRTKVSAAHNLPHARARRMRSAMRSSTAPSRSAYTPPAKHKLELRSPKSHLTSPLVQKPSLQSHCGQTQGSRRCRKNNPSYVNRQYHRHDVANT